MHIYSAIPEINYETANFSLKNNVEDDPEIVYTDKNYQHNKEVSLHIHALHTSDLHIQQYQLSTRIDLRKEFRSTGQFIRYVFYFKGHSSASFGQGAQRIEHVMGSLYYSYINQATDSGYLNILADEQLEYIVLYLSPAYYKRLLQTEAWTTTDSFYTHIFHQQTFIAHLQHLNIHMYQILDDIMNSGHMGINQKDYIDIKLKELLLMISVKCHTPQRPIGRELQEDTFEAIKSYLIQHLEGNPTVEELSERFHIPVRKLKLAFQEQAGMTVHQFLVISKMETAKKLIKSDYNVNELASKLGYQSVSHFIKIFKKHFGLTPKEFLLTYK